MWILFVEVNCRTQVQHNLIEFLPPVFYWDTHPIFSGRCVKIELYTMCSSNGEMRYLLLCAVTIIFNFLLRLPHTFLSRSLWVSPQRTDDAVSYRAEEYGPVYRLNGLHVVFLLVSCPEATKVKYKPAQNVLFSCCVISRANVQLLWLQLSFSLLHFPNLADTFF